MTERQRVPHVRPTGTWMIYQGQERSAFVTPGTRHDRVYTVAQGEELAGFPEDDVLERADLGDGRVRLALRRDRVTRVFERQAEGHWRGHPVSVTINDDQAYIGTGDETFARQNGMEPEYHSRWVTTVPLAHVTDLTYSEIDLA